MAGPPPAEINMQYHKSLFQHDVTFPKENTLPSVESMSNHSSKHYPRFDAGSRHSRDHIPPSQTSVSSITQQLVIGPPQKEFSSLEVSLRRKTPSGVVMHGYNGAPGHEPSQYPPNKRLRVSSVSANHRLIEGVRNDFTDKHSSHLAMERTWKETSQFEPTSVTKSRSVLSDPLCESWNGEHHHTAFPTASIPRSLVNHGNPQTNSGERMRLDQTIIQGHHLPQRSTLYQSKRGTHLKDDVEAVQSSLYSVPSTSPRDSLHFIEQSPPDGNSWSKPSLVMHAKPDHTRSQDRPLFYNRSCNLRKLDERPILGSTVEHGHTRNARGLEILPESSDLPVPALSKEDASQPERVLSWAHKVYLALISTTRDAKKREMNPLRPPNSSSRRLHIRHHKRDYFRPSSAPHDSLAYHTIPGIDQSQQLHYGTGLSNDGPQVGTKRRIHEGHLPRPCPSERDAQYRLPNIEGYSTLREGANLSHNLNAPRAQVCASNSQICENLSGTQNGYINVPITARHAIDRLAELCLKSYIPWMDGLMQAGCLAYALGEHLESIGWFLKMLDFNPENVEAMSKLALALKAAGRKQEAEEYWRLVLKRQPHYLEAAEQLVELLCSEQRQHDALQVIEHVRLHLHAPSSPSSSRKSLAISNNVSLLKIYSPGSSTSPGNSMNNMGTECDDKRGKHVENASPTAKDSIYSYGTRRYSDPSRIDRRMLALMHLKGNILYSMNDHVGAAQAFEEVVLVAVGFHKTLLGLINYILDVSSRATKQDNGNHEQYQSSEPLLLTPRRAIGTANLCFPNGRHLLGITAPNDWNARSAATCILSNSLLSLAKVLQDGLSGSTDISSASGSSYEVRHILALYYLSFSLKPSPSTANNIGILLANVQRNTSTRAGNYPSEELVPYIPGVVPGSGTWLALKYYEYGLFLDPNHAHIYTNFGSLLKDLGQLPWAIDMYQKAVLCDEKFDIALANLANAVKDQGKTKEAIYYYKRAVEVNPTFSEAICGLANVLNSICDWTSRGGVAIENGAYDRWHVDDKGAIVDSRTEGSCSCGWVRHVVKVVDTQFADGQAWGRGVFERQSLAAFVNQLLVHQNDAEIRNKQAKVLREALKAWSGQIHEGARTVRLVERAMRQITRKWYHDKYVHGIEQSLGAYARPQLPAMLPPPSAPKVLPFHTFTLPLTAKQIRSISQRNGLRTSCTTLRAPWLPTTVYPPPPPPRPQLKIGYVSSDFNNHPLAHLMQSVFGLHDKSRVNVICYATTTSDHSSHRQKIEKEAPLFIDASGWSTEQLVQQIVYDGVHILINLNGYTRGAKNEVFAARPAPIQMSFMGYAGSLGAEWCDYILADEMAIPVQTLRPWRRNVDFEDLVEDEKTGMVNDDWVYGENIIYTREAFFCCDHRQSASAEGDETLTWEGEQKRRWKMRKELFPKLKDSAVIFGNFNQLYKIDPTIFRTWLRILTQVPDAILWLLRFPDLGEEQLRKTARAWVGEAVESRIHFTDVAPKAIHITRACVIDLFLDTPECNAHTTAADCLWSGTPLLTLPRYPWKMASRMAAGIVGGVLDRTTEEGRDALRELIATSEEGYEYMAVRLARGLRYLEGKEGLAEGRLMELRKLIWQGRWRRGGLFDTERWVREVEDAYEEAWRRWIVGEGGDIRLADL